MSVRFDDLQALGALVGAELGPWGEPMVVSQAMIDAFAALSGDRQWIHVDPERAAREGPFGGTVAHGYLVLGLLTALAPRGEEIVGFSSAINYGLDEVRFVSPVPSGSAVHARRRIAHVRKKGPRGTQITFDNEIRVVGADRPAVVCKSIALFLR